jgi:hypothetical protein
MTTNAGQPWTGKNQAERILFGSQFVTIKDKSATSYRYRFKTKTDSTRKLVFLAGRYYWKGKAECISWLITYKFLDSRYHPNNGYSEITFYKKGVESVVSLSRDAFIAAAALVKINGSASYVVLNQSLPKLRLTVDQIEMPASLSLDILSESGALISTAAISVPDNLGVIASGFAKDGRRVCLAVMLPDYTQRIYILTFSSNFSAYTLDAVGAARDFPRKTVTTDCTITGIEPADTTYVQSSSASLNGSKGILAVRADGDDFCAIQLSATNVSAGAGGTLVVGNNPEPWTDWNGSMNTAVGKTYAYDLISVTAAGVDIVMTTESFEASEGFDATWNYPAHSYIYNNVLPFVQFVYYSAHNKCLVYKKKLHTYGEVGSFLLSDGVGFKSITWIDSWAVVFQNLATASMLFSNSVDLSSSGTYSDISVGLNTSSASLTQFFENPTLECLFDNFDSAINLSGDVDANGYMADNDRLFIGCVYLDSDYPSVGKTIYLDLAAIRNAGANQAIVEDGRLDYVTSSHEYLPISLTR